MPRPPLAAMATLATVTIIATATTSAADTLPTFSPRLTLSVTPIAAAASPEAGRPPSHLRLPALDVETLLADPSSAVAERPDAQRPPRVVEYSDAYSTRARIHRIASFATLPLFGAEAIVGQSLYSSPTSTKKSAHLALAGAIGGLFAVNTVTGVWNLVESRHDPTMHKRRLAHGLPMLAADAGFLATAALGPSSEHGHSEGSPATHRAVAFTSIGLATAGYVLMLFGGE